MDEKIVDEMDCNVVKDGRSTPEKVARMRAQMNVGVIVTENRKDFQPAACDPYDIEVQTADEFLSYALDHDPPAVIGAIWAMASKLRAPTYTPLEVLTTMKERLPTFLHRSDPTTRLHRPSYSSELTTCRPSIDALTYSAARSETGKEAALTEEGVRRRLSG